MCLVKPFVCVRMCVGTRIETHLCVDIYYKKKDLIELFCVLADEQPKENPSANG